MTSVVSWVLSIMGMVSIVSGGQQTNQSPAASQTQQQSPAITPEQLQQLLQALQAQKPAVPKVQPPMPINSDETELQKLEEERQRLLKEQQIEEMRREIEAMKTHQAKPLCVPAPPCNWLCREQQKLEAKIKATADKKLNDVGDKAAKATKGDIDRSDIPTASEISDDGLKQTCPAGYVPAKSSPLVMQGAAK